MRYFCYKFPEETNKITYKQNDQVSHRSHERYKEWDTLPMPIWYMTAEKKRNFYITSLNRKPEVFHPNTVW